MALLYTEVLASQSDFDADINQGEQREEVHLLQGEDLLILVRANGVRGCAHFPFFLQNLCRLTE